MSDSGTLSRVQSVVADEASPEVELHDLTASTSLQATQLRHQPSDTHITSSTSYFGTHESPWIDSGDDHAIAGEDDNPMSRAPLLVRGSPALGTGSYGGLPYGLSTSPEDSYSDSEIRTQPVRPQRSLRGRIRKKSRLNVQETRSQSSTGDEHSQAGSRSRRPRSSAEQSRVGARSDTNRGSKASDSRGKKEVLRSSIGLEAGMESRNTASVGINIPEAAESVSEDMSSDDSSRESDNSGDDLLRTVKERQKVHDNSPYPQVRASVPPTDNITLSINTPRMWTLSILFAIFGSATNLFFSLRYPSVSITPIIALLLAHPLALLWDRLLKRTDDPPQQFLNGTLIRRPIERDDEALQVNGTSSEDSNGDPSHMTSATKSFQASWKRRLRLYLAQGRWNEKEHCCVFIASNVSFGFAFATDVIVEQTQFYHQEVTIMYQILLILSTQILGYAFAGLARRFLVRPSGMIWPGTLVSTAMFSSLHREENRPADGWRISRWRFFFLVFCCAVAFYLLPGFLMPALSYFNVVTWFAPKSVVIANLFGVSSGLGLFPVTFDWSQIAYIGSPLVVPFWAALNIVGGLVIVMWIIAPIMYYCNVLWSSYMPILSTAVFDNTGKPYDVSKILTKNFVFDEAAYKNYSRVYLPITYVLSYGLQFAAIASLLTHTACWHGKDIWKQWRNSLQEVRNEPAPYCPLPEQDDGAASIQRSGTMRSRSSVDSQPMLDSVIGTEDVHNRLMRRYDDVPMTWYLLTGISMTLIGMFVVEYYPVYLPWYGLLLSLGICAVLFIPIGIVQAITNQHSSIYLICQLICGVVFPGRPVANMVFVTYGYISSAQGLKFTSDLKLGHYMKIPPRILFSLQLVATVTSSLTQIASLNWMLARIPGICTSAAINGFTCPIARVHFNGSILWGVVGPQRFFGPGALYRPLVWAFFIGAAAPVVVWLVGRRLGRRSVLRKVNLPVLFGSISWIPPATGLNFSVWFVVCWLFNDVIRRRRREWWKKYTMTLSAALDSGLAVGVVVVFFGLLYPGWHWVAKMKWWGTEVYKQGCDWQACAYREVADGERFGPSKW